MTFDPTSQAVKACAAGPPEAGLQTLTPPPSGPPVEPAATRTSWFGPLAVLLLVALAAFLGSSPPQNSDLWLHLAAGRLVAEGSWQPGVDSFTYTGEEARWVNHSWLFDTACYLIYRFAGGWALVALRAVVLGAVALLVLAQSGPGRLRSVAVLSTALMLLAVAPWLPLRPEYLSLLLLGLTLVWLLRLDRSDEPPRFLRDYLPLLVLFALWANLDSWFVLGPLALALHCLHRAITVPSGRGVVALAALGGFAVCLANPHLWHVFQLPAQLGLSPAAGALIQDPLGKTIRVSPFQNDFYRAWIDLGPGAVAAALLVVLGLVSFLFHPRALLSWRSALWLVLLLLGLYQARALGLFAVATALLACANLRDAQPAEAGSLSGWRWASRPLLLVGLLAAVVAAWPGWLQGRPYGPRRWSAEPSRSVQRLAELLDDWRQQGRVGPDARCFNFSLELANQMAWACPGEQTFLDSRHTASSRQTAEDFLTVRQALLARSRGQTSEQDWQAILRRHRIRYVLLSDSNRERRLAVFSALLQDSHDWALLGLAGEVAVFGWKDGEAKRFSGEEQKLEKAALFPDPARRAPKEGPSRDPDARTWWEPFRRAAWSDSPDREEAIYYLSLFHTRERARGAEQLAIWDATLASSIVTLPGRSGAGPAWELARSCLYLYLLESSRAAEPATGAEMALTWRTIFVNSRRPATGASLLACIRAARRAVHDDPDDGLAWLMLGEAYLSLHMETQEVAWDQSWPQIRDLRRAQVSTAFDNALKRQPGLARAHQRLAQFYLGQGTLDLALKHLRAFQKTQRGKDDSAETDSQLEDLEKRVDTRLKQFAREAPQQRIQDRAQLAVRLGLDGKARDLLLQSDASAFGWQGAVLQLELMLVTGEARDVDEFVDPKKEEVLGADTYHWLRARATLALGDYERASTHLAAGGRPISFVGPSDLHTALSQAAAQGTLLSNPLQGGPGALAGGTPLRMIYVMAVINNRGMLTSEAGHLVIRGLAALEMGDGREARRLFKRALETYVDAATTASGGGLDFPARPAAEAWLRALEAVSS